MTIHSQPPQAPGSLQDLKAFVQQFELFLPEDKRDAIRTTIAEIEANGGIRDEAHGQQLLTQLLQALNLV